MIHAKVDNTAVNPYVVGALLASAYPERIGKKWKEGVGVFQLSGGELVAVEPSDALSGAEWLAIATMHRKMGGVGKVFLASVVDPADLKDFTVERDNVFWDSKQGAVVARREWRIGAILLDAKPLADKAQADMQQVVCEAIVKGALLSGDRSSSERRQQQGN